MSKSHAIFLRPVTSLYFGRPGALPAGEAHSGTSWFPPPISAFQGMIRTKLLEFARVFSPPQKVQALVGTSDTLPDEWSIIGPFPACERGRRSLQLWFPIPAFLFPPNNANKQEPVLAQPLTAPKDPHLLFDNGARCADGQSYLTVCGNPIMAKPKPLTGWISSNNLKWALYLGRDGSQIDWNPRECAKGLPPFVKWEIKPGLKREKTLENGFQITGRAQEGMLYFLKCLRFSPDSGIAGWLDAPLSEPLSPAALEQGPIVAGKKGGVMAFEKMERMDPLWEELRRGAHLEGCRISRSQRVWIVLLSPGRWKSVTELESMLSIDSKVQVTVESIISSAPMFLGGFSMANRKPRPAVPWYPPGTSILVKLRAENEDDIKNFLKEMNNRTVLASKQHLPFGYGHVLLARPMEDGGNNEQ